MDFGILIGILGIAFSAFTYYRSEEIAKKSDKRESEREKELREIKEELRAIRNILESQRKHK